MPICVQGLGPLMPLQAKPLPCSEGLLGHPHHHRRLSQGFTTTLQVHLLWAPCLYNMVREERTKGPRVQQASRTGSSAAGPGMQPVARWNQVSTQRHFLSCFQSSCHELQTSALVGFSRAEPGDPVSAAGWNPALRASPGKNGLRSWVQLGNLRSAGQTPSPSGSVLLSGFTGLDEATAAARTLLVRVLISHGHRIPQPHLRDRSTHRAAASPADTGPPSPSVCFSRENFSPLVSDLCSGGRLSRLPAPLGGDEPKAPWATAAMVVQLKLETLF